MKTIGVLLLVVLLETVICRPDQALIEAKKKAIKDSRLVTRDDCPQSECNDGYCIPDSFVCDSWVDCGGGEDDLGCGDCASDEFQCEDGACISADMICDGNNDCIDGHNSDERGCYNLVQECETDEYSCDNSYCITGDYRCDGDNDCGDNSDEIGCDGCGDNEFKCHDGECIPAVYACDAWVDCSYGEDDCGCGVCALDQFECGNELCVPESYLCDGDNDCGDDTDELGCSNMSKRAFLSAIGLNKATKDKKAAGIKRGKQVRKNLKHKKSELTTKTAGKKSDVKKAVNKKSRVDQTIQILKEAIKSKFEK